jgi:hypothetical protein
MVSTCVRAALRLVTTSAVPSATRHTFPYAAPLGMYLAQRDSFVIVETVIPSMQAAEAGVVPGAVSDPGLLKATIEGPEWLTGGSFGMEHSVVALVICTTAGVILLLIAIRRGHMMPLMWKR